MVYITLDVRMNNLRMQPDSPHPNELALELSKLDKEIVAARLVVVAAMSTLLLVYFGWFGLMVKSDIADSSATWGTLGDFFGGLLNPLIASLALYWLTRSVRIQKEELNETRLALRDAASAQQAQVRLAALTALSSSIIAEIDLQRNQLYFVVNQMSSLQHNSIRNLDGQEISVEDAQALIGKINAFISDRLGQHRRYEAEITSLLDVTRVA